MANDEHVALLKQGVDAWNKWREENPDIRPDLTYADLGEADLRGVKLGRANLLRADLSGANLSWADLSEAYLLDANLHMAILPMAELSGADLSWADLSGAELSGADLSRTDIKEADLKEADLRGADFTGANLREADLREAKRAPWHGGSDGSKLIGLREKVGLIVTPNHADRRVHVAFTAGTTPRCDQVSSRSIRCMTSASRSCTWSHSRSTRTLPGTRVFCFG